MTTPGKGSGGEEGKITGGTAGWLTWGTVICLLAGLGLNRCQSTHTSVPAGNEGPITDTVASCDTVRHIAPAPVSSRQTSYMDIKVPAAGRRLAVPPPARGDTDTAAYAPGSVPEDNGSVPEDNDSVLLRLPVVQKVYEGEDYRAYVSGVYAGLDSIDVFHRRETVTVRQPPKRWHVGPTIGCGYTPRGFQPYIGVSVTYSIISF